MNYIAVGDRGVIIRSEDGGLTWSFLRSSSSENLTDISVIRNDYIFVCGQDGTLMLSTDGVEFNRVPAGIKENIKALCMTNEYNGTAICEGGKILNTNDAGNTWTEAEGSRAGELND